VWSRMTGYQIYKSGNPSGLPKILAKIYPIYTANKNQQTARYMYVPLAIGNQFVVILLYTLIIHIKGKFTDRCYHVVVRMKFTRLSRTVKIVRTINAPQTRLQMWYTNIVCFNFNDST
jgi:hypothetical protein